MSTTMLKRDLGTRDLCDNIGLVGVSTKWSYVTASPSHHDKAIPILFPLLFMHVGHPLFKIRRIFDLLVSQRGDSPFVYRDGTGWPASLPYIRKIHVSVAIGTQSGIRLHKRVYTYGQNMGVLKK